MPNYKIYGVSLPKTVKADSFEISSLNCPAVTAIFYRRKENGVNEVIAAVPLCDKVFIVEEGAESKG